MFKKKDRSLFRGKSKQRQKVRDSALEQRIFKQRAWICVALVLMFFSILLINLINLQVVNHDGYQTRSNENRIRVLPVAPQRGIIYDRNHIPLADNRAVYRLVIYPNKQIDTKSTIEQLNKILGLNLDDKEISNILTTAAQAKRLREVEFSDVLSEKQIAKFAVIRYAFPNVQLASSLKRFYPFADIATHAIGYVSRINDKDVQNLKADGRFKNYDGTIEIGKLGIERFYEKILHGITGSREVEVNSHGQIIRTLNYNPPRSGRDLILSLDIRLQYYAQELLGNMKGAIVAIEPQTGEILAFYSNPSFDPNLFVRGIGATQFNKLLNDPNTPLINRVTQGSYSPASTVKPLMALMGLNEGLIKPQQNFFGGPHFSLPGSTHKFRDWRANGHGLLDVYRAIEVSADTYFYDLAHRAGIDTIHEYLDRYGFGRSSGIDLYEESLGVNPSKAWKLKRVKQSWHIGDTIPIGIGQGYWNSTLIQLAKAHSIIANKGKIVTPHFLKEVRSSDGSILSSYQDKQQDTLVVKSEDYFDVVSAGMYLVINGPEGTARRAFMNTKYKAAGKSGTAQIVAIKQGEKYNASSIKAEHRDNALFVAYAPYHKPRILTAIILENEGGGSSKGAPILRKLMDKYLLELKHSQDLGDKTKWQKFGLGGWAEVRM